MTRYLPTNSCREATVAFFATTAADGEMETVKSIAMSILSRGKK
jgi:hypothetical protein